MPDGLLYLALVIVWAFVLIPMWLRKHDEANESRSVDRFSRALSSLSARRDRKGHESTGGMFLRARAVVMPGRPKGARDLQVTVTGASAPDEPKVASAPEAHPEPMQSPATVAARRRRQVLLGLLLVTGLVLVAGLLHKLPIWAAAVPALLVVAFLVSVRRQRKRTEQMRRRRVQRQSLTEAARAAEAGRTARAHRRRRATPADWRDVEFDVAANLEAPMTDPGQTPLVRVDERGWAAVPTTLPTYVTAPTATRVPRVIDRTTPGSWSGAAMVDQARMTRQEEAREESGMRVESFEIRVPRPAASAQSTDDYAERYVDRTAGAAELDATDDESVLSALLDDPRTGAWPERDSYRRAAG